MDGYIFIIFIKYLQIKKITNVKTFLRKICISRAYMRSIAAWWCAVYGCKFMTDPVRNDKAEHSTRRGHIINDSTVLFALADIYYICVRVYVSEASRGKAVFVLPTMFNLRRTYISCIWATGAATVVGCFRNEWWSVCLCIIKYIWRIIILTGYTNGK